MTCKDCLYFKRCVSLGVELNTKQDKEADKNCRHFKNKADFVEVRYGEWIERAVVKGQVYCSECGTIEKATDNNYKSRRCPNCGAVMDGRSDT